MKNLYPGVLLCSLTLLAGNSFAADAETGDEPVIMDEVVVTAGRISQKSSAVSANLTIINREELEQSASRSVGELFAEKGIGAVRQFPGSLASVSIRGFRTDTHGNDLQGHVLVLLDGRRAGTGNLAKILTGNVERIEIIRGPGAVQYGSAGMGGVINIITRTGTGNSLFIQGGGGSFGKAEGSAGATFAGSGLDFAGTFTYQTVDDYDTGSGAEYGNTGINASTGLSGNLGYSFSATNRIGLIFTGFDVDEAGNPGYFDMVDLDDSTDKSNYSLDTRYTGETASGDFQWMARYFFGRDKNKWSDPLASNPDGWDEGASSANDTDQQGAQAQITALLGSTSWTTGFDWLDYDVENSWTPNRTSSSNPAIFLLANVSLLDDRLNANFGMRYDWYDVEVNEPAGRDDSETHFTPSIGLAWMATPALKLRAQYAEAFMMPSADQLAADYTAWGSHTVGNPDLSPETSTTTELGIDYNRNSASGSLTWFYTDFEDKIVTRQLADGSTSWINQGDATISGVELELGYDVAALLNWSWEVRPYLNMTILSRFEDNSTDTDLLYVSGTNYAAGLVVADGDGFFCRFNAAYTSSQLVEDWQSDAFPTPVIDLDSSVVADLTASWRLYANDSLGAVTLRGELRNLLDEDYAYVKGYPMPGRNFYLGLRWEY